jgi:hypothetical protein
MLTIRRPTVGRGAVPGLVQLAVQRSRGEPGEIPFGPLDHGAQVVELDSRVGDLKALTCAAECPYPVLFGSAGRLNLRDHPSRIQSCAWPMRSAI